MLVNDIWRDDAIVVECDGEVVCAFVRFGCVVVVLGCGVNFCTAVIAQCVGYFPSSAVAVVVFNCIALRCPL